MGSSDYLYSAVYPLDKEEPLRYLYVIENRKPSMQVFFVLVFFIDIVLQTSSSLFIG